MTSHGDLRTTTSTGTKVNELRIPPRLIIDSYRNRQDSLLEIFINLKLRGSRIHAKNFFKALGVSEKTGKRAINKMIALQWVGHDGKFIFTRSWSRIKYKKKFGLYLPEIPPNLKDSIFAHALKTVTRRMTRAQKRGRALPKGLPVRYYTTALNISERNYFRKIRSAVKNGYIKLTKQRTKIGTSKEFHALRKNLHGVPLFKCGKWTVIPEPSIMEFI
jgi:hypothetical protein